MKFGPWHPDKSGVNVPAVRSAKNCLPAVNGFAPLPSIVPVSAGAIDGECLGAIVVYGSDGVVHTFAGDATKLYKLQVATTWDDVSRTSGGIYHAGGSERWAFGLSGGLVIAATIGDAPQKYLLGTSTDFTALGGTPPQARYVTTMRDFVLLAGLLNDEMTVHWSGLGNPEHWTPGTQSCDTNTFQDGGPIRGLVGGEVAYVLQAEKLQRMTFAPGSATIMQFDEIEGGRGLLAPYSLVKLGGRAFYFGTDGFYELSLAAATVRPLGIGKWSKTVLKDIKRGNEITTIGAVDPFQRFVIWAYNSADAPSTAPNRAVIYDWTIDEATLVDLTVTAVAQVLTTGVTLDTMDGFGTMETLPFSLDSPAWLGGAGLLGLFGVDRKLSTFSGPAMQAEFITNDSEERDRTTLLGSRPHVDTRSVTVAVSAREAEGDAVLFPAEEVMEDNGVVPAWCSGYLTRARIRVAEGASWTKMTGIDPARDSGGSR